VRRERGVKISFPKDKKSFIFGLLAGIAITAIASSIVYLTSATRPPSADVFEFKESIDTLANPCVERYNTGIFSNRSDEIRIETFFPALERELVTREQVACILGALNFPEVQAAELFELESGRLDNADFQVKWQALPTCPVQSEPSDGKNPFTKYCSNKEKTLEIRELIINLKDFRP